MYYKNCYKVYGDADHNDVHTFRYLEAGQASGE